MAQKVAVKISNSLSTFLWGPPINFVALNLNSHPPAKNLPLPSFPLRSMPTETIAAMSRPGSAQTQNHNPPAKLRWGELDEDDGEDLDFLLPPKQVIGPDQNGIKKVIEYKFNEDGNKVKITTTSCTRKLAKARLSKRAVERRSWPKFGDAVHEDVGSRLTMVSTEEILLERPRAPGMSLSCVDFQ